MTMKQWQITDEWSFDGLKLVDVPQPEPGPGEVLLKMSPWAHGGCPVSSRPGSAATWARPASTAPWAARWTARRGNI